MGIELHKQINLLTFSAQEKETSDKLEEDLRDISEDLKLLAPHEAGLIKESSSYVRPLQVTKHATKAKTKKVCLIRKNWNWSQKETR